MSHNQETARAGKSTLIWTFAITSIALFMVTLDNLVVTTALPVIRTDLDDDATPLRIEAMIEP